MLGCQFFNLVAPPPPPPPKGIDEYFKIQNTKSAKKKKTNLIDILIF